MMGLKSASSLSNSWRAAIAGFLAMLLGTVGLITAAPADAAPGDPEYLTVDK